VPQDIAIIVLPADHILIRQNLDKFGQHKIKLCMEIIQIKIESKNKIKNEIRDAKIQK